MTKAYYRAWRPATWDEVIGQDHVVKTLRNAIAGQHFGHAYLFSGPRGIGKTTVARLLAKAINCTNPDPALRPDNNCPLCEAVNNGRFLDLIEIDAASNTSVEDVRDLRDKINYKPSTGEYKIYIIDEVHMLSTAAFNALLKTLEEPPPHAIFILATTEVQKIPATVLSRCQRYEFRRIPVSQIVSYLKEKTTAEKIAVSEEALTLIARQATGSMRDAVSLLDQLASSGEEVTIEMATTILGTATSQKVVDLIDAIIAKDQAKGLQIIQQTLDGGADPRQFARQAVDYLRNVLLVKSGNSSQLDITKELRTGIESQAAKLETSQVLRLLKSFNQAANEMRNNWQPGLLMEMAFIENSSTDSTEEQEEPEPEKPQAKKSFPAAIAQEEQKPTQSNPQPFKPVTQPQVEKPTQQSPKTVPTPSGEGLENFLQKWPDIFTETKKRNNKTGGLLNSCTPSIKNGALVISFTSDVLKNMMETSDNLSLLKQIVHELTGKEIEIKCVVSNAKTKTSAADLGVDSDGLVGTALSQGGHIVHRD